MFLTAKPSLMLKVITAYRGRSDHEAVYYSHETLKIGMEASFQHVYDISA